MNASVRAWLPAVLIGLGIVSLLDRLGWVGGRGGWVWGLVLLVAGAAFIAAHLRGPKLWWAIFPGLAFIAVAVATFAGSWGGLLLLLVVGVVLLAYYLKRGGQWWTLVGAGAFLSLALQATIERIAPRAETSWLLFVGLGATLAVVYFRREQAAPGWTLTGAIAFIAMALVSLLAGKAVGITIAISMMLAGGLVLWRQRSAPLEQPKVPLPSVEEAEPKA